MIEPCCHLPTSEHRIHHQWCVAKARAELATDDFDDVDREWCIRYLNAHLAALGGDQAGMTTDSDVATSITVMTPRTGN